MSKLKELFTNRRIHFTKTELDGLKERINFMKNSPNADFKFNYVWLETISKLIEQSR